MPVAVTGEAHFPKPAPYLDWPHANAAFGFEAGAQLHKIDPDVQPIHAGISASIPTVATSSIGKTFPFFGKCRCKKRGSAKHRRCGIVAVTMGDVNPPAPPHVLLLEDHTDLGETLSRLLAMEGYRVTVAGRLGEAIRLCRENHFDVLICDIELPDGDGLELPTRVREKCRAPAIVFSGSGDAELRDEATERGFIDYLMKPVPHERLISAIRRAAGYECRNATA